MATACPITPIDQRETGWPLQVLLAIDAPAAAPAGTVTLYYGEQTFEGMPNLGNLFVQPEARGAGVGRRLLDAAIAAARADGHVGVWLHVEEQRTAARRLYESAGFAYTDEVTTEIEPAPLYMILRFPQ